MTARAGAITNPKRGPTTESTIIKRTKGGKITSILKELATPGTVGYEVVDPMGIGATSVCTLVNLKFERFTTTPKVIIFSGELVKPEFGR
jgi:hypothetical protein